MLRRTPRNSFPADLLGLDSNPPSITIKQRDRKCTGRGEGVRRKIT